MEKEIVCKSLLEIIQELQKSVEEKEKQLNIRW